MIYYIGSFPTRQPLKIDGSINIAGIKGTQDAKLVVNISKKASVISYCVVHHHGRVPFAFLTGELFI